MKIQERWVVKGFGIALIILIVVAGFGQAVLQLWNHLIPEIFGLRPISFWQAVGLLALSWILFGGMRGPAGFHGPRRRRAAMARWESMTDEEREAFRKGLHGRGCGWQAEKKVDQGTA